MPRGGSARDSFGGGGKGSSAAIGGAASSAAGGGDRSYGSQAPGAANKGGPNTGQGSLPGGTRDRGTDNGRNYSYGSQAPGASNKGGPGTKQGSLPGGTDSKNKGGFNPYVEFYRKHTPDERAVAAHDAAVEGPTWGDKLLSAAISLIIPGGLLLRSEGVLPSAEDLLQKRVNRMLGLEDSGPSPMLGDNDRGTNYEEQQINKGTKGETEEETEEESAGSLLELLQELGTRGYLDQLSKQNAKMQERALSANPGPQENELDFYSDLVTEQRLKNIAAIESLMGTGYGSS